jgi:hypothetical protein
MSRERNPGGKKDKRTKSKSVRDFKECKKEMDSRNNFKRMDKWVAKQIY